MRNWFDTGCDCSNPEPIVGAIVGGKKFPFGTVKQSDYNADKEETDAKLVELDNEIKSANTKHEADVALINRKINSDIESVKSQIVTGDEALNSKINANSTAINSKVDSAVAVISALQTEVNSKADAKDLTTLQTEVSSKASSAALSSLQTEVNGKVSKESGKGLSANDYSDAEKAKVSNAASEVSRIGGYFTMV